MEGEASSHRNADPLAVQYTSVAAMNHYKNSEAVENTGKECART